MWFLLFHLALLLGTILFRALRIEANALRLALLLGTALAGLGCLVGAPMDFFMEGNGIGFNPLPHVVTEGNGHSWLRLGLLLAMDIGLILNLAPSGARTGGLTYARHGVLALAAAVMLLPFAWLVIAAFKAPEFLMEYTFLPPLKTVFAGDGLTLDNAKVLMEPTPTRSGPVTIITYTVNSLFLACATTVLQCVFSSLTGFALAKYRFKGRGTMLMIILATMMIPGMILLAPMYALMTTFGWVDTFWALIVPGLAPAFGIFLFRQAMLSVPDEMIEAARIDGASELRIWWSLALPLVRPMTAAFCLVVFLNSWNGFLGPQVFLHSQENFTLPIALAQYVGMYSDQQGVFLMGTLLAIIPPAVLFFALQKEFVSGLASGAVKG